MDMARKYQLGINGEKVDVTLDVSPDNAGGVLSFNGREHQVTFTNLDDHSWFIECDGHCSKAYTVRNENGTHVAVEGRVYVIEDLGKTKSSRSKTGGPGKGPEIVTPPTPAMVVRILVQTGQVVDQGQSLIVVSAMKMEMTLTALYAGVVSSINTREGSQVAPGDILVEIAAGESTAKHDAGEK